MNRPGSTVVTLVLGVLALVLDLGCSPPGEGDSRAVARVNGSLLTVGQLENYLATNLADEIDDDLVRSHLDIRQRCEHARHDGEGADLEEKLHAGGQADAQHGPDSAEGEPAKGQPFTPLSRHQEPRFDDLTGHRRHRRPGDTPVGNEDQKVVEADVDDVAGDRSDHR